MATRRRRVKATTPQRAQAAGFPRKKLKEAPPAPAAPPVLVEVGGWSLNTAQYRRFLRLQSRMQLRDPAAFRVECYPGFAGYGMVEVVENSLRSMASKPADRLRFVDSLCALTAFFRVRCAAAAEALGDSYEVVDNIVDVLSPLWQLAWSTAHMTPSQWVELRRFRLECADVLEMHSNWAWLDCEDGGPVVTVPGSQIAPRLVELVLDYLAVRFPWQQGAEQLLARQSEYVVSADMREALAESGSEAVEAGAGATAAAEAVQVEQSKTPSGVIRSLRSIR